MESYTGFAEVYDELMDNVPYDDWGEYLAGLLSEYGVGDGIVCELGCGTGSITRRLAAKGYDMIGIDSSAEMLEIAREKEFGGAAGILYLEQDMREFELYGTAAAIVSVCDSLNYITKEEDLLAVFRLVNNYLDPSGLFVFDMNTEYKYREVLGDATIADNREDVSLIWENFYDPETKINEYDITIFKKADVEYTESDEADPDTALFERFCEVHYQKAYPLETVRTLLEQAGLVFVAAFDAFTREPVAEKSERMYIIAREGYQENKLYENTENSVKLVPEGLES